MAELEFHGAAGQVTGSCHILRIGDRTVLLDCGMIQGGRREEARNAEPFPFDPAAVDAVLLSHAHIDHSGRLPLLVKRGFRGALHSHAASLALLRVLLEDAAGLEQSRVNRERRRHQRHNAADEQPLFTQQDVDAVLRQGIGHAYNAPFEVLPGLHCTLRDAGHILGSAALELQVGTGETAPTLVFSGDLGQYDSPILDDPASPAMADVVLLEATYGNRTHRDRAASLAELGAVLRRAREQGGNVLIPAFAVGRSQELLFQLGKHFDAWEVGRWQVFLDSPLAAAASRVYWDHGELFDEDAAHLFRHGERMPALPNLRITTTPEESRNISRLSGGAIIIAGSGMCTGGRILHHLKRDLGKPATHVVFTGYQPPGSLGRRLVDREPRVRIHGEEVAVRAEVHTIGGLSAHGDRDDLLRWHAGIAGDPETYLVHGDPEVLVSFQQTLEDRGVRARVAVAGDTVDLTAAPT